MGIGDGIRCTASQRALVYHRGTLGPEIEFGRQLCKHRLGCGVHIVPSIGEIRDPTILFDLAFHGLSPLYTHCASVATLCDLEVCIYSIPCHMYTPYFAMNVTCVIQGGCDKGRKLEVGMVTLWQARDVQERMLPLPPWRGKAAPAPRLQAVRDYW